MLPERLLLGALPEGARIPSYLGAADRAWLDALLQLYRRFAGRPFGELHERLLEPLPVACPPASLRRARHVLDRMCSALPRLDPSPRAVRRALFLAAGEGASREAALARAGEQLELTPEALESRLFGDLPSERRVLAPPAQLHAQELSLRVNLALAQGLVARATRIELALWGNARDVVRMAHLGGLLCIAREPSSGSDAEVVLELSGPLSLFRRTVVYGRALAAIVPRLSLCQRFELRARCQLDQTSHTVVLRSGDPIFPPDKPRALDSKLEERFARDFERVAPDWELLREPAPLAAARSLMFPDFALWHRRDPRQRYLIEIIGFWTADYLTHKLAQLRTARVDNLILCIDARRNCGAEELPDNAHIVRFRNRIDPKAILQAIAPPTLVETRRLA